MVGGCVHKRKKANRRRKRWCRQRSCVTPTESTLNFFGLPTHRRAGPVGHEGLREWVRAGEGRWRRKSEKFVIF